MNDNYTDAIRSVVVPFMKTNGITQVKLALALDLPQSTISNRLAGLSEWKVRDLVKLHEAYGLEFPLPALAGAK